MHKVLWQTLLICPAILVSNWLTWQAIAQAVPVNKPVATQVNLEEQANRASGSDSDRLTTIDDLNSATQQTENQLDDTTEAMDQVTSVSQLSDVQPTDWAFQAVQSLVERYGCIAGYPDGTYRGNRALTRYEFAAGLNACLDRVNELIAAGTSNRVSQEDLNTIKRLQDEFGAELASIRGRVDALEINTAKLQAQQFSTTTKLNGLAWLNVTGATADGRVRLEGTPASISGRGPIALRAAGRDATGRPLNQTVNNPNTTFSYYTWLSLNTSFTGKDSLVTQLVSGNGISPANQFASAGLFNTFGVPFTDQTGVPGGGNTVAVRELFYSFPVTSTLQVAVGPRLNWYRTFDNNRFTFFLTGASSFNSSGSTLLNAVDRGSGAVVLWKPSKKIQLNIGYMGENTEFLASGIFNTSSNPARGLFGGTYTATAELTFSPTNKLNLRLLYNRSRLQQRQGIIGGAPGEPLYGLADDGFGGPLRSATADTYEANLDWLITPGFGVFGRYTYASTHLTPRFANRPRGDVNAQSVQGGLAFPDLGKEGALATLSYVIPFSVLNGRNFLISDAGNGGVQYDLEATYYYPVSNHVAIVPAFYLIKNANNFGNNPNIYVGNVRLQFAF